MTLFRTITVSAPERAVEYVDGSCRRVLGPGRHRKVRRGRYRRVSVLERVTTLAPQEVPTAEGINVRVSAAVRWRVTDPQTFLEVADEPFDIVYLAVQLALREALVGIPVEEVAARSRTGLGTGLVDATRTAGARVGIEVVAVVVKDVVVPAELRAAYAEQVTARARGAAQLEAARAETAALRSLANGAKLLDEHPALARLRLVQALPAGSRVEIVAPE